MGTEIRSVVGRAGVEGRNLTLRELKGTLGDDENSLYIQDICGVPNDDHIFARTYQIVHSKGVNLVYHQLYLSKHFFKKT